VKRLKLYLDNCCFNRPYDDQKQEKIYIETEAKLFIQNKIKNGEYDLVWSFILDYENSANPDIEAMRSIQMWKNIATETVTITDSIREYANVLHNQGFGVKDSLHISSAVYSGVDFLITVDKGILKRKNLVQDLQIINPMDFISMEEDL